MALQSGTGRRLETRQSPPSQHARSGQKHNKTGRDGQNGGSYRPRETRSISALTIRSTRPGRLSSSQDVSIGRSISLTRSSSVRALLLSTVWASELKADSTADTVERDSICCSGAAGAALSNGGGS